MSNFWGTLLRAQYNIAARENDWNFFPEYTWENATAYQFAGVSKITCTVKDLLSETYGKMPDQDAEKQILMEYQYFTDTLANTTVFDSEHIDAETSAQFKAWMLSEPNLAYYNAA